MYSSQLDRPAPLSAKPRFRESERGNGLILTGCASGATMDAGAIRAACNCHPIRSRRMRPSSPSPPSLSPLTLALAFAAGFLAVPLFHQIAFLLLYLAGVVPAPPYNMRPTAPLGVPSVVSASFWGGVWGVVFALVVPRFFRGAAYWVAAAVLGAVVLTLVYIFVAVPLKGETLPASVGRIFVLGAILNAAWGIGWALLFKLFERARGGAKAVGV